MAQYQNEKFLLPGTPQQRHHPHYVEWLEAELEQARNEISRLKKRLISLNKRIEAQARSAERRWRDQADHLDYPDDNYDR